MFPAAQSLQRQENQGDKETSGLPPPSSAPPSVSDWLINASYKETKPSRDHHVTSNDNKSDRSSSSHSPPRHKKSRHDRKDSSSEKRKGRRKSEPHHHRHKKHSKRTQKPSEPVKPDTIWLSETGLDPKDAYRLHKKPDPSNLSYGTLYSGDQASYKRYYGNLCLGLGWSRSIKFTDKRNRVVKDSKQEEGKKRYYEETLDTTDTQLTFIPRPVHAACLSEEEEEEEEVKEKEGETPGDKETESKEGGAGDDKKEDVEVEKEEKVINKRRVHILRDDEDFKLPDFLKLDEQLNDNNPKLDVLPPDEYISQGIADYNRKLAGTNDVSLWLEFIAFQDQLLHWGVSPSGEGEDKGVGEERKKKLKAAITERKISIYEKALGIFPYSIDLIIGHMELVEGIWDTEKLVEKWKDIVFYNSNQSLLWIKYIEFCLSRFSYFQSNSVIAIFTKSISTLTGIAERRLLSHYPEVDAERKILAIYVFLCYFLREAGYIERAIATFQALIEFSLLCPIDEYPADGFYPRIARRKGLESFWETDEPRFGEEGAVGWTGWEHKDEVEPTPLGLFPSDKYDKLLKESPKEKEGGTEEEEEEDIDIKFVSGQPLNKAWLKIESYRDEENSLPGRLSAPVNSKMNSDSEDPEHITLFDDLIQIMFMMPDPELHYLLLLEFVRFLGVPCSGQSIMQATFPDVVYPVSMASEVMTAPSCILNSLRSQGTKFSSCYFQSSPLGSEYSSTYGTKLMDDLSCGSLPSEKSSISTRCPPFSSHTKHFISTVFNQSLGLVPKDSNAGMVLMCTWLQFELLYIKQLQSESCDVTEHVDQLHSLAIELVGSFTSHNYSFLWDFTYSLEQLMPHLSGKPSQLSKDLLSPFTKKSMPFNEMFSLSMTFVEYLLGLREPMNCYLKCVPNRKLATYMITSMSDYKFDPVNLPKDVPNFTAFAMVRTEDFFLLHIRKVLAQINAKMMSVKKDTFYIHFPKLACHVYFIYLTEGIEDTFKLCQQYEFEIKRIARDPAVPNHSTLTPLLENLYMLQARLIIVHGHYKVMKPSVLREFIYKALELFPAHYWFLQYLLEVERRSSISGRLRRFFESSLSKSVSLAPLLFAIRSELERREYLMGCSGQGESADEPLGGILHRVRALFRRGSESRTCQLCPAFWRCYMKFEIEYGGKGDAKAIFYQAIHSCPGVKVLYTDGIHYFPEDIEKILEIAEEKLLRIRTPLDVIYLLQDDIEQQERIAKETMETN